MACVPEMLRHLPPFALLDDEESTVRAGQVNLRQFSPRQRIYKIGDPGNWAYVVVSGKVRVSSVGEDNQEIVMEEAVHGEFFGFACMLEQTAYQTSATAIGEAVW